MWAQDRFERLQGLVWVASRELTDAQLADLIRSLRSALRRRTPPPPREARS